MFRATSKKKRKKTVTRLRPESDDEEEKEEESTLTSKEKKEEKRSKKKSKKTKKKGLAVRSFYDDEPDEDDAGTHTKKDKHRKRKRGLGFGGAPNVTVHDDEDEFPTTNEDDDVDMAGASASANVYGKDALEKLKQEQKYKAPVVAEDTKEEPTAKPQPQPQTNLHTPPEEEEDPGLGDYVPLDGSSSTGPSMILTGDQALEFQNRKRSNKKAEEHFDTVMEDSNFLNDDAQQQEAEETSAWEAQLSRRAGIQGGKAPTHNIGTSTTTSTSSSAMSLVKLRSQIQSTIAQLETQDNDTDRACQRRKVEAAQTKEELQRQETELEESGKALEHYQELREKLSFWTGALRDLKSKVQPIQDALVDWNADRTRCPQWQDWEDDMCAVLHQAGLLDRVLGRQPPDVCFEDTTTYVDEFGRDVKSQHAMNREKRNRRRLEIQRQQEKDGKVLEEDDSDAGMDYEDLDSFDERRSALRKALEIPLQELDEEYTQLDKLAAIFRDWKKSHPEDFKQCFAYLSFGDLASVLVQVELCRTYTSSRGDKGSLFGWLEDLCENSNGDNLIDSMPPEELRDRVMEKAFIPFLTTMLEKGAYNVISRKQSLALSSLYAKLVELSAKRSNPQLEALTRQLLDYIKARLENVALIFLNSKEGPSIRTADDEDEDGKSPRKQEFASTMHGASGGQLRRITKMLVNVLTYWAPHMSVENGGDVIEFLLDFISGRYLFLLSSLKTRAGEETTKDLFVRVWEGLRETKWLDQPGRMLQAAPLRAAASVYKTK